MFAGSSFLLLASPSRALVRFLRIHCHFVLFAFGGFDSDQPLEEFGLVLAGFSGGYVDGDLDWCCLIYSWCCFLIVTGCYLHWSTEELNTCCRKHGYTWFCFEDWFRGVGVWNCEQHVCADCGCPFAGIDLVLIGYHGVGRVEIEDLNAVWSGGGFFVAIRNRIRLENKQNCTITLKILPFLLDHGVRCIKVFFLLGRYIRCISVGC